MFLFALFLAARSRHFVPTDLGHGTDYFDQMFTDLKRNTLKLHGSDGSASPTSLTPRSQQSIPSSSGQRPANPEPTIRTPTAEPVIEQPVSSATHDYTTSTSR